MFSKMIQFAMGALMISAVYAMQAPPIPQGPPRPALVVSCPQCGQDIKGWERTGNKDWAGRPRDVLYYKKGDLKHAQLKKPKCDKCKRNAALPKFKSVRVLDKIQEYVQPEEEDIIQPPSYAEHIISKPVNCFRCKGSGLKNNNNHKVAGRTLKEKLKKFMSNTSIWKDAPKHIPQKCPRCNGEKYEKNPTDIHRRLGTKQTCVMRGLLQDCYAAGYCDNE